MAEDLLPPPQGGGHCVLTLLDDLLGLLSDSSVPQEPPLTFLADLTLQVMLFRDL